ncbi:Phage major tail protein 2 [Bremerella volcania]|uniref:Phage major tail protein 2 n=1 Tax=Bremerella volcania TaxID=2527984 RepID=A0A518CCF4_9BACT|nr:phage tail tube protein [Bremerella volcania]QDU76884.1 Phage major tail protein 2 [Bremerella volcania]
MATRLGMDAKLYRNTGDYATPVWVEVSNVKDVTLNLEKGEADVTTRANAGWRATVGTLKDASIEFQMVWDTVDAGFDAIRQAFFNNAPLEFAVMDGDITDPDSEGLRATFDIFNFTRNEALEEAIMVDVSIKPTYADNAPEWITGGP